jgi:hypothetical protein
MILECWQCSNRTAWKLKLLFINISIGTKLLFLEQLLRRVGRSKPYTFKIKIPYNKGKKPKSGKKIGKKSDPTGTRSSPFGGLKFLRANFLSEWSP